MKVTLLNSLYLSQFSGLSNGPFWRPTSAANVALISSPNLGLTTSRPRSLGAP